MSPNRVPPDHREFLVKRDFSLPADVDRSRFVEREPEILANYGHWLEALELSKIRPYSDGQRHFLRVCNRAADPITEEERVWLKMRRLQDEARQAAKAREDEARAAQIQELDRAREELAQQNAEIAAEQKAAADRLRQLIAPIEAQLQRAAEGVLEDWWGKEGSKLPADDLESICGPDSAASMPLKLYIRRKLAERPAKRQDVVCPVCGGDGGAKGECFKCDGTGWL
jgi:uncharacterized protein YifE (UPF0438 family)